METTTTVHLVDWDHPADVSVRVEGEVTENNPKGKHPQSIFVTYRSPAIEFQFSLTDFQYQQDQYVPRKDGGRRGTYAVNVDRDSLPDAAFEEGEQSGTTVVEFSDKRVVGFLFPSLFHDVVLPSYNEWRVKHNLDWGRVWGKGRNGRHLPFSHR